MSANLLPTFNGVQYANNIELLLQIKGSKLSPFVEHGSYTGKQASPVDQMGSVEATEVTTRFEPITRTDVAVDRRWVFPTDYDLAQMVDTFDKLRMFNDPQSKYVLNATYALGRRMDRLILNAFFGTAKTGESGGTNTSFTSGNEVDVAVGGTNSRLNVAKLLAVKELAMAANIDLDNDPLYCVITAKDHSALLNEVQITSSDFNGNRPVLVDGKVTSFLGINFIHCELAESVLAGTNEVTLPVWCKSGMHFGTWNGITTNISQRNDLKGLPWQVYAYMTGGATRIEENKVFAIESYRA